MNLYRKSVITATAMKYFKRAGHMESPNRSYDLVIVGGGIMGMACAREMQMRHSTLKIALLEKEQSLAAHQSGHSTGVIYTGINLPPTSLNAQLCKQGAQLTYDYCDKKSIPNKKCGKLIVAHNEQEVSWLMQLYNQALKSAVSDIKLLNGLEICEQEPHARGIKAIWSPNTGIVDWGKVTESFAEDFESIGGTILLDFEAYKFSECTAEYPISIHGGKVGQEVHARYVFTCGGLQADILATRTGCSTVPQIIPFRSEYLLLKTHKSHLVRGNIYNVPNPKRQFWGMHFTPRLDGRILFGPFVVLAFQREGYSCFDINPDELINTVSYAGFQKMFANHIVQGLNQFAANMLSKLNIMDWQNLVPKIEASDFQPGPTGVSARSINLDGDFVEELIIDKGKGDGVLARNVMHCRNIPSPGATNSLAVAKLFADKMEEEFGISKEMQSDCDCAAKTSLK